MSWCFGGQQGDKVQEGDLYHQGMETGGEHRELRGAGTTYPDFKQLDVALQYPFSPVLHSNFQQERKIIPESNSCKFSGKGRNLHYFPFN